MRNNMAPLLLHELSLAFKNTFELTLDEDTQAIYQINCDHTLMTLFRSSADEKGEYKLTAACSAGGASLRCLQNVILIAAEKDGALVRSARFNAAGRASIESLRPGSYQIKLKQVRMHHSWFGQNTGNPRSAEVTALFQALSEYAAEWPGHEEPEEDYAPVMLKASGGLRAKGGAQAAQPTIACALVEGILTISITYPAGLIGRTMGFQVRHENITLIDRMIELPGAKEAQKYPANTITHTMEIPQINVIPDQIDYGLVEEINA